jgi:hypothetical protein
MGDRGQGHLTDMAVFAILIALACSMLVKAGPIKSETATQAYATNLARSTLLAFQHATVDGLGGLTYELNISCPWGCAERRLQHKTFAQLLIEDAFCNLRVEVDGHEITLGANQNLDSRIREFLRRVLDDLIGGRFGYRLIARTVTPENSVIRVYFETEIKNLPGGGRQVCSETLVMNSLLPQGWLTADTRSMLGIDSSEPGLEIAVEITLELWSK